jgi:ATP-dependent RNA helicase RhlE
MTLISFESLDLINPIKKALSLEGYTTPTPIQAEAIPLMLAGKDIFGIAQTGTGKTAAFAIPILQQLYNQKKPDNHRYIKALICTPTRELAVQIGESFSVYGKYTGIRNTVVFGGVGQLSQTRALEKGVDVLVATPGRLLDLIQQGYIDLGKLQTFVLDEADRMLDMGFIHDIKRIIKELPDKRQSLCFSATMPPEIMKLAEKMLKDPVTVEVTPQATTVEIIEQSVYFVDKANKRSLLAHLLKNERVVSALVFTRTKHGADRVVKELRRADISSQAIHGNKSQNARQRALNDFKKGAIRILVATDIAARGIDIEELSHVINYDLPNIPETYVHRIGRTGRAGAGGIAISFCDTEERAYLKDIEKLIGRKIPVIKDHPYPAEEPVPAPEQKYRSRPHTGSYRKSYRRN